MEDENKQQEKKGVKKKSGNHYKNVLISYESCVTMPLSQLEALVTVYSRYEVIKGGKEHVCDRAVYLRCR
jgi:hypothetical protein